MLYLGLDCGLLTYMFINTYMNDVYDVKMKIEVGWMVAPCFNMREAKANAT